MASVFVRMPAIPAALKDLTDYDVLPMTEIPLSSYTSIIEESFNLSRVLSVLFVVAYVIVLWYEVTLMS